MATVVGTDYTKRKKSYLEVVVGTEEAPRKLHVLPPTGSMHKELSKMSVAVERALNGELEGDEIDMEECLAAVARFLSNNAKMEKITPEYLDKTGFDITDLGDFIGLYLLFITKLVEGKN